MSKASEQIKDSMKQAARKLTLKSGLSKDSAGSKGSAGKLTSQKSKSTKTSH